MEKDDELKGEGNSYDFGARMLDPRIGRFLTRDPLSINFPNESNYAYVSNNPLIYKDPTGEAKILTLNFTDERTGKKSSISFVIDEDYIEGKASKYNNILAPTEYSWHDVNVVQDVKIDKNGKYTFGNSTSKILDRVITTTDASWIGKSDTYARMKIDFLQATTENEYPEENDVWSGGGIDFYSENGEGSGTKAKDRSKLDYVNGDDMMTLAGMFNSFGKEGKGVPFPTNVKGKFSNVELQSLLEIFNKSKELAEAIKEISTAADNVLKVVAEVKKYNSTDPIRGNSAGIVVQKKRVEVTKSQAEIIEKQNKKDSLRTVRVNQQKDKVYRTSK